MATTPVFALSAGLVPKRAPNGQTQRVAASDVAHYESLGAVVVQ